MTRDGDEWFTRQFSAGCARFVVRCPSPSLRDLVERIFVDLDDVEPGQAVTVIDLFESEEGLLTIGRDGSVEGVGLTPNEALTMLVPIVSRLALDADPDHLHLHAAGLAFNGRGVLVSAPSGTGKTTLAATLASRGWTYVSDEAIALYSSSTLCTGFGKPLVIKPSGRDLIAGLDEAHVADGADDYGWWHVPASAIGAPVDRSLDPAVIVVLRPSDEESESTTAKPISAQLHPADAVVELMNQTMDAARFGPDAAVVLAHLAARCTCITLSVGRLNASADLLESLALSDAEPCSAREIRQPDPPESVQWRVPDGVRSIIVGDRAVVHDSIDGTIAALDSAGTAVWKLLCGEPSEWLTPKALDEPGTRDFLAQLSSFGFLDRTSQEVVRG